MQYLYFKYREGDWGLQEVIECLKFKTKTGEFQLKLVRTPNLRVPICSCPLVCKGEDFQHCVYAMHHGRYGQKMYFSHRANFPDSPEGFEQAKNLFNSRLLEFQKMKDQASPKRWPMFKSI